MKHFTSDKNGWSDKFNFVDKNNTLVGFDASQDCCENFGWSITGSIPKACTEGCEFSDEQLEPYVFDTQTKPTEMRGDDFEEGGAISFPLIADGLPTLYLTLFNSHNGYYSHGFTFDVGGTRVMDGSL